MPDIEWTICPKRSIKGDNWRRWSDYSSLFSISQSLFIITFITSSLDLILKTVYLKHTLSLLWFLPPLHSLDLNACVGYILSDLMLFYCHRRCSRLPWSWFSSFFPCKVTFPCKHSSISRSWYDLHHHFSSPPSQVYLRPGLSLMLWLEREKSTQSI